VADEDGVIVLPAGLSERDIATADALAATAAYAATAYVTAQGPSA
jgi:regulator of RNase E activity RraA